MKAIIHVILRSGDVEKFPKQRHNAFNVCLKKKKNNKNTNVEQNGINIYFGDILKTAQDRERASS